VLDVESAVFLGPFLPQDTKKYLASARRAGGEMVLTFKNQLKKVVEAVRRNRL